MRFQKLSYAFAAVPALVSAYPAYGSSSSSGVVDGPVAVPPSAAKLAQIARAAGGNLGNGPPPPKDAASPDAITNFQLIAFNELFETAFFTDLIKNISDDKPGYKVGSGGYQGKSKKALLEILERVQAQEVLHALNANGALKNFGQEPIQPCKYKFPTSNLEEAITFAATFTNVVLGTLQDVQVTFAKNAKQSAIVGAVGSVIGQEGEQEGFYNLARGKFPSSSPFLTPGTRDLAFTAINANVVPGSCPNKDLIKLKEFKPLSLETNPKTITTNTKELEFSWPAVQKPEAIAYISGAGNIPTVVDFVVNKQKSNTKTTFVSAKFPFDVTKGFSEGLTVATATKSKGPFKNGNEVSDDTIFGPAPILVESNL